MEIVSTLRTALADKVGQERFDLWFGAGTRLDYDGRALRIGAPSRFFLEWIRANFRRHIETACGDVLGNCPAIEFHLDAAATEGDGDSMQPALINGAAKHAAARSAGWRRSRPRCRRTSSPAAAAAPERRRFASLDTSWPARPIAWPSPRPRWSSASRASTRR